MNSVDLEHQVLLYAHKCAEAGDIKACLAMGIDLDDMKKMRLIDTADIYKVHADRHIPILRKLEIDKNALDKLFKSSKIKRQRESVIDQLLLLRVGNKLMDHFFSLSRQEVSNRRKILGVPNAPGRPIRSTTNIKEKALVTELLKEHRKEYDLPSRHCVALRCKGLIFVAEHTGITVQEVWEIIHDQLTRSAFEW